MAALKSAYQMKKFRKGDKVVVLTGRDKGKQGEILKALPGEARVVVQGVNMVKKHRRPGPGSQGGIEQFEAPLAVSNIAHVDPKTGEATRVGFKTLEDGTRVRFAKKSGEVIESGV